MKIELDISKAWVTWTKVGFGCMIFVLFHPDHPGPLGFVWGFSHGGAKKRFEVYGSYTEVYYRRLGVRSRINQEILKSFDLVTSAHGSRAGRRWMLSQGYRFDKKLSQWYKGREK